MSIANIVVSGGLDRFIARFDACMIGGSVPSCIGDASRRMRLEFPGESQSTYRALLSRITAARQNAINWNRGGDNYTISNYGSADTRRAIREAFGPRDAEARYTYSFRVQGELASGEKVDFVQRRTISTYPGQSKASILEMIQDDMSTFESYMLETDSWKFVNTSNNKTIGVHVL